MLPCVRYKITKEDYGEIYDLSTSDELTDTLSEPDTWEDYYAALVSFYNFFDNVDSYQVKIESTTSTLNVSVFSGGQWVPIYRGAAVTGSYYMHLQAHWGSGVTIGDMNLQDD